MDIHFLEREFKDEKIEWGIIPYYLMAIREQHMCLWGEFVKIVNAIDNNEFDEMLKKARKKRRIKNATFTRNN